MIREVNLIQWKLKYWIEDQKWVQKKRKQLKSLLKNLKGWIRGEWYVCRNGHRTHFRHFYFAYMRSVDRYFKPLVCKCGEPMSMENFGRTHVFGSFKVTHAYYDHGLGQYVRGSSHRRSIIKEQGLIEVGNENLSKITEKVRKDKEKADNAKWEESVTKELYRMGVR